MFFQNFVKYEPSKYLIICLYDSSLSSKLTNIIFQFTASNEQIILFNIDDKLGEFHEDTLYDWQKYLAVAQSIDNLISFNNYRNVILVGYGNGKNILPYPKNVSIIKFITVPFGHDISIPLNNINPLNSINDILADFSTTPMDIDNTNSNTKVKAVHYIENDSFQMHKKMRKG